MYFPFAWSFEPPADVRTYLEAAGSIDVGNGRNIAALLNQYVSTLGLGIASKERTDGNSGVTSCCPRVRMSNFLRGLVREKKMDPHTLSILLDHSIESATRYYGRFEGESDESEKENEDED